MGVGTREHSDLMEMFEREYKGRRLDRESKDGWARGIIYQDGFVNELFLAYRRGAAYGAAIERGSHGKA